MDAAYFQAAVPEPYVIFGLRLLPLSLGRYRLLHRFGCAFVADGEAKATMQDLLMGIVICSLPVPDFLELLESPRFGREMKRLGRRINMEMRADPHFSLLAKFGLFQRYIIENSRCPRYWDEQEERPGSGAHWSHNLEIALRSNLGWTLQEVNEAPLAKALVD